MLQHTATCCNTLQRRVNALCMIATDAFICASCNVLQYAAVWSSVCCCSVVAVCVVAVCVVAVWIVCCNAVQFVVVNYCVRLG